MTVNDATDSKQASQQAKPLFYLLLTPFFFMSLYGSVDILMQIAVQ